jgi:C-terminal processing protease CtpA/Prc
MLRHKWLWIVAVAILALAPIFAGEHGKKCTMNTQDCLDHMAAQMKSSGWVGLEMDQDENTGVLTVLKVVPGSPAEAAGIQPKDILFALNGVPIDKDHDKELYKVRKEWKPGQSVTYTIKRDGADRQVTLTLAPMPADVLARYIGQHMLEHASSDIAAK